MLRHARLACTLATALASAGCSVVVDDPVTWWHQTEGGRIAADRPPPPRADAPYPNLASVPPRPVTDDTATRDAAAAALQADRANALYGASIAPLPAPAARPAPPDPSETAGGTMNGATPPPPPAPKPAPAAKTGATMAPAELPDIPAAPPAPAQLPGLAQITAPTPPQAAPMPGPAPVSRPPRAPLPIAFARGSAVLPLGNAGALRALAAARGADELNIATFGEANDAAAAAQQAALALAYERARTIAMALVQDGVPLAAMHITAEATGRGGIVRLER